MQVYRISKTRHAQDLSGEGARLFGGRWNNIGTPCVYTAETRALAILEYTANVSLDNMPRALSIITLEIPDKSWGNIKIADLPGNWKDIPPPNETKNIGSQWLIAAKMLTIKIPSVIIPFEYNYIINPLHADMGKVNIIDMSDFSFDVRLKQ